MNLEPYFTQNAGMSIPESSTAEPNATFPAMDVMKSGVKIHGCSNQKNDPKLGDLEARSFSEWNDEEKMIAAEIETKSGAILLYRTIEDALLNKMFSEN